MNQDYTIVIGPENKAMRCRCDKAVSIKEFNGFCEECWMNLTPQQRAIFKGIEFIPVPVQRGCFAVFVTFVWNLFLASSVLFLLYKGGYLHQLVDYARQLIAHIDEILHSLK